MVMVRVRAKRVTGVLAGLVALTLLITGCVPASTGASTSSPELSLYLGQMPAPAELEVGAVSIPAPPTPPADFTDEAAMEKYLEEMQAYQERAEQVYQDWSGEAEPFAERVIELVEATRGSGAESVAAWQSLFVASGVPVDVGAGPVSISGSTGYGYALTDAELRLHALAAANDSSTPLTTLAHVIEGIGFPDGSLAEALRDDLAGAAAVDYAFGQIFTQLDTSTFNEFEAAPRILGASGGTRAVEEIMLSAGQVNLVLRRLSGELLQYTEERAGVAGPSALGVSPGVAAASTGFVAASGPCTTEGDPWRDEARKQKTSFNGYVFGRVLGLLPDNAAGNLVKFGAAGASLLASLVSIGVKMHLLRAEMTMPGAPLERTKDENPGEVRDVDWRFSLDENVVREVTECLNKALAHTGMQLPADKAGATEGIDVNFKLVDKGRVWLASSGGTSTYVGQTDADGRISFGLEGRPQKQLIPEWADSEDVTVTVRADANINNSSFLQEILSLPWTAMGGPLAMVPELLQRWKLSAFERPAPVRDWAPQSEFDVTLTANLYGHASVSQSGTGECGPWEANQSTTGTGVFESPEPVRVVAELITDGVASGVLFRAAEETAPQPEILSHEADGVKLFEVPVMHRVDQQRRQPGADPMPEHYQDPRWSSCGDGIPGQAPAPDCGLRSYPGFISVASGPDGAFHLLNHHEIERQWLRCGHLWPASPLSAVPTLRLCQNPLQMGGDIPAGIFDRKETYAETSGVLKCTKNDYPGLLDIIEVSWTMTFCRIVEGEPAC